MIKEKEREKWSAKNEPSYQLVLFSPLITKRISHFSSFPDHGGAYINPMHAPHVVLTMLYFKDPNARPIFFILCWSWCIVRRRLVVVASLSSRMYYVIWWAQYWQKCMCAETNELHPALHATPYACMWWWTNRKTRQQPCTCTCTLTADCWFFMHMASKKCILRPRWLARRRRLWIFRSIPIDYI